MSTDIVERGQQPAAGRPASPKPSASLPTTTPPAGSSDLIQQLLDTVARLTADLAAERAKAERLTGELQQVAIEIALAESLDARREQ